ncbi:hypothetical protein SMB34_01050 [Thalassospira permensis NBRC 106175]|uniref:Uncharacterized protein n=1 Tax=Thalassospira permensis NBRC 106175 TaxID=1353532 RepID=A0ABR4TU11_9PROT|nr:hypothetical protein SMB34_01050 [Thalassospira permensis NBRC 106175]
MDDAPKCLSTTNHKALKGPFAPKRPIFAQNTAI